MLVLKKKVFFASPANMSMAKSSLGIKSATSGLPKVANYSRPLNLGPRWSNGTPAIPAKNYPSRVVNPRQEMKDAVMKSFTPKQQPGLPRGPIPYRGQPANGGIGW